MFWSTTSPSRVSIDAGVGETAIQVRHDSSFTSALRLSCFSQRIDQSFVRWNRFRDGQIPSGDLHRNLPPHANTPADLDENQIRVCLGPPRLPTTSALSADETEAAVTSACVRTCNHPAAKTQPQAIRSFGVFCRQGTSVKILARDRPNSPRVLAKKPHETGRQLEAFTSTGVPILICCRRGEPARSIHLPPEGHAVFPESFDHLAGPPEFSVVPGFLSALDAKAHEESFRLNTGVTDKRHPTR